MAHTEERETAASGTLHIVATPIGNLGDISPRAIEVLKSVDLILAEDTRTFSVLATRFGILTPKMSYHDHNERTRSVEVVERLAAGESIALVSDAGTPCVADPGYRLISLCRERQLPVSGVPGPSAALFALSLSGLPCHRFVFEGFLPQRSGRRGTLLREIVERGITTICFESPHRILKTLEQLASFAPHCRVFMARELTKIHEELLSATAGEMLTTLRARPSIKGEIVLVLSSIAPDLDGSELPTGDGCEPEAD